MVYIHTDRLRLQHSGMEQFVLGYEEQYRFLSSTFNDNSWE
jgi:hypothetical protein